MEDDEVEKLIESIWNAEQTKTGHRTPPIEEVEGNPAEKWRADLLEPREDNGWLVSGGNRILVQVRIRREGQWELALAPWMDADLKVLGIVEAENGRVYEVEIKRESGEIVDGPLPAKVASDGKSLRGWLADRGVSIGVPDLIHPLKMSTETRIVRYLEAQGAQKVQALPALGWHNEIRGFLTHDGVIRAGQKGLAGFDQYRPDPALRNWAPYHYGIGSRKEAQRILKEVLTFHDETVAAVFGAWWAATFLKRQIQAEVSQFPILALEAPSESGKSTGFFQLMLQLSGHVGDQVVPTRAALRDFLTATYNGIVWMDDLDSLEQHGELLRSVTVGGGMVKKSNDNRGQVTAILRGALVVSGEHLGIGGQKALLDRVVMISVPSPVGRMSTRNKSRPQWDDVLSLRSRHPDLTEYAGSLVQMALENEDLVSGVKALRTEAGRHADKIAIVRLGARILARLLDEDPDRSNWVQLADRWAGSVKDYGDENALTMRMLPTALANTGWKKRPEGPDGGRRQVTTPVFIHEDPKQFEGSEIWFNPTLVAQWWEREPPLNKRVDKRIESADALAQQARAMGLGGKRGVGRKLFRLATGEGVQLYWRINGKMAQIIIDRSRGDHDETVGEEHGN